MRLKGGEKMFAYEFKGYWKDVGTIDSLWESNIDLLDENVTMDLSDENWKIYSKNPVMPPHFISSKANVQNSLVADGCNIYGNVDMSVLFSGVYVAKDAIIRDSIIMPGAKIEEGAVVNYSIISENTVISKDAIIGARPENMDDESKWGITVVGDNINIGRSVVIKPKSMVDKSVEGVLANERE